MHLDSALLAAIVALGLPAGEARALPADEQSSAVPVSVDAQPGVRAASLADKNVAVGTLVLATVLHLGGTARGGDISNSPATTTGKIAPRPQPVPAGAKRQVHGDANPVLSYVLGDIGLVAAEGRPRSARARACSAAAAVSMSAVNNMRLLDFMRTLAGKAGMRVVDKGIGNMRITGEAFSGIALKDLLRETSGDSHFLADIKGCTLVLSPVQPAKDVAHARSETKAGPQSMRRQDTDLAKLVLAIAERSGRSVTMIGDPVPLHARLDGAPDMNAEALASAINRAAAGRLRVTVKEKTIVLQYLAAGTAATSDVQEPFREQGQFLVLPTLELGQKTAKKQPAKGDNI